MWKHGACLAAVAGVLLACSGGDGGGHWYKQKSPPSAGAAGTGPQSAGQAGQGDLEPQGSGGSKDAEDGKD
jgi:hypothetical protein